jgi:heterotetrameric sarcosine oxidase gamma subunit
MFDAPPFARRSAIAGLDRSGHYGRAGPDTLRLGECPPRAMIQASVWPERAPEFENRVREITGLPLPSVNRTSWVEGLTLLWVGPNRWLVVGSNADARIAALRAVPETHASLVELGEGRATFELAGKRATDVLAKGVPLDFEAAAFAIGGCAQSASGRVGVLIHRIDVQRFRLYVYRGFARTLWEWLEGVTPDTCAGRWILKISLLA